MAKLKFLVIHCTATPEGREVTAEDIRNWHLKGRGWSRVGYTDLIHLDGTISNLTPFDHDDEVEAWELTNGVRGKNSISRHIVYAGGGIGNKEHPAEDTRTMDQENTLAAYCFLMVARHPDILIAGHNQFAAKACPSFDVPDWLEEIGIPEKNIYKP
jgi:N-acetylmuramoyl-L-alanine amidase